jgi:nitrogen-specific signal transduction histidine kinase
MLDLTPTSEQPILRTRTRQYRLQESPALQRKGGSGPASLENQLFGIRALMEMIGSGRELPEVLGALCRFVELVAEVRHCGVYLIDWRVAKFRDVAANSLPASFNGPLCGLPVRSETGPCATAACLKTQVIVENLETDPLWKGSVFCDLAVAHELKSCWSTPIHSATGEVVAIFVILQRKPVAPTAPQQAVIGLGTQVASVAIARAQAESALRRTNAHLAQAQGLSQSGSFCWRVATDEIVSSEQMHHIFGFDRGERVTVELIASRVHPEDIALFNDAIDRARSVLGNFDYEHRIRMPDQSVKYLHVVVHAICDHEHQLEYIGSVQDVTQRRLSEEALSKARSELAHAARMMSLGALTASIAHEVNQPLSGIVTNASTCLRMLATDPPDIEVARETARRTLRDANRASEVVTRLRALFARKSLTAEPVALNDATREVIALSLSGLQRRSVILQPILAEDLPLVTGDRVQLQQVILNLLLNAADAMSGIEDRPRQLVIRTEREAANRVRLSVQDSGVGLGKESAQLFEPFYTTKSDGMGIGLSVSRFIIESHCGNLFATQNDGPGATFAFSIPCDPADAAAPAARHGPMPRHGMCAL